MDLFFWLSNTTFLLGLFFLVWFSYLDLKKNELPNQLALTFFIISLIWAYINPSFVINLSLMAFLFILGLYLWNKNIIGGGDVKVLPSIIPFLGLYGLGAGIGGIIRFMIIFGFIGGIYGLTANLILKKKQIAFLPAITLSYIVFWLPYFL